MGIEVSNMAPLPDGRHTGIIIGAEETTKVFDPSKGPESVVEFTVQPGWKAETGADTLPATFVYAPVLNGISALSRLLKRLGVHPASGEVWEPSSLIGVEISFVTFTKRGFVTVNKESIQPASAE
jgi:hypothetical protein